MSLIELCLYFLMKQGERKKKAALLEDRRCVGKSIKGE